MNDYPRRERARRLVVRGMLTPRDEELLTRYANGESRAEIARALGWMGGWNGCFPQTDRVESRLKLLVPSRSARTPTPTRNTPEWFWHRERYG